MSRLHELLRHHPAYLLGRPDPLSDFERLECRTRVKDEFRPAEFDAPAWRFADAVAVVIIALAVVWGSVMLTTGLTGGSPSVETMAESADANDRSP